MFIKAHFIFLVLFLWEKSMTMLLSKDFWWRLVNKFYDYWWKRSFDDVTSELLMKEWIHFVSLYFQSLYTCVVNFSIIPWISILCITNNLDVDKFFSTLGVARVVMAKRKRFSFKAFTFLSTSRAHKIQRENILLKQLNNSPEASWVGRETSKLNTRDNLPINLINKMVAHYHQVESSPNNRTR